MSNTAVPVGLLALTAAFGTACGGGDGRVAHDTTNAAASFVLTITATDFAFEAPDTVPAGFTEVRLLNHGEQPHEATVVRLDSGRTLRDYVQAYAEAVRSGSARPAWARFLGGTLALDQQGEGTAMLLLEPGSHALVCFVPGPDGAPHLLQYDQAHAFVVRDAGGERSATVAPVPTLSVSMVDYDFELSAPMTVGRHVVRVENAGVEPHHLLLFKLADGTTVDHFQTWLQNGMQGEPAAAFVAAMSGQSSGAEGYLTVDVTAGEYVFVCLVAGRDDVPHIAKGMLHHVRVE